MRIVLITAFPCVRAVSYKLVFAEEQRNAPYRRQSDNDINDTAYNAVASSERPRYKVKTENSHQAPVKTADKQYPKRDFIHHFQSFLSLWLFIFYTNTWLEAYKNQA